MNSFTILFISGPVPSISIMGKGPYIDNGIAYFTNTENETIFWAPLRNIQYIRKDK